MKRGDTSRSDIHFIVQFATIHLSAHSNIKLPVRPSHTVGASTINSRPLGWCLRWEYYEVVFKRYRRCLDPGDLSLSTSASPFNKRSVSVHRYEASTPTSRPHELLIHLVHCDTHASCPPFIFFHPQGNICVVGRR